MCQKKRYFILPFEVHKFVFVSIKKSKLLLYFFFYFSRQKKFIYESKFAKALQTFLEEQNNAWKNVMKQLQKEEQNKVRENVMKQLQQEYVEKN